MILTQFAKEVEETKLYIKIEKEREVREKKKKMRRHSTDVNDSPSSQKHILRFFINNKFY